jgi:nucleotide-binding universal stress UspA family protein
VVVLRVEGAAAAEAEAGRYLEAECGAAGLFHSVRESGRTGSPEEVIAAEARERDYGLVVLAPAGRHGFIRLFYGSMVAHVVQRVSTSVLVVRGERAVPPARVLACVSGARHSLTTVSVAAQAAGLFGSELTLLTVLSQVGITMKGAQPWDRDAASFIECDDPLARHLKIAAEMAGRVGPRPSIKVREGLVGEEILKEIRDGGHDLLVAGTHWAQDCDTVYEDLTSDLVRTSPISTLVVGLRAGLL